MKTQLSFSVIIRCYNASRYIAKALNSVIDQTYNGPIEILVLYDEGTRDDSLGVIDKFIKEIDSKTLPNRFLRIHSHTHMSPFRSLQVGLKLADGDYITILDYDNVFPKDYFEKVFEKMKLYSDVAPSFLFTNALLIDANGSPMNKFLVDIPHEHTLSNLLRGNYIDVNTMVLSREMVNMLSKKLEMLASRFYDWIFEDWLIALLALKHSVPLHIDNTCVLYRVHEENITYGMSDMLGRLFNIERSIKTLLAFYQIEEVNLGDVELKCLRTSLIRYCLAYSRLAAKILKMSRKDALLTVCRILAEYIV